MNENVHCLLKRKKDFFEAHVACERERASKNGVPTSIKVEDHVPFCTNFIHKQC